MGAAVSTVLTLADWAKKLDPDGKVADIVELLSQQNGVLEDMLFKEGNLPTGHQTTVRTGLPAVFWRLLNQGVQPSKSRSAQIVEGCGMLEAWSEVDKDLAELNGDVNAFRLAEGMAFIEAMNQEMASKTFYGNSSINPEQFNGLSLRYSSLEAANGSNIINAGGVASDNSSVWMVAWGENTCHGIFPKGSKAGIFHEDLGLQTVQTATGIGGAKLRAYQEHWQVKVGIALRDWRYVARIANIDTTNLTTKTSAADLVENMIRAQHRLPNEGVGTVVYYMNRTCVEMLDIQRREAVEAGGQLNYEVVDGKRIPMFRGFPVRICDALIQTETEVT